MPRRHRLRIGFRRKGWQQPPTAALPTPQTTCHPVAHWIIIDCQGIQIVAPAEHTKKKRKASDHKRGKVATPEPLSTDIAATAASAATLPRLPSSSAINREVSLNQNGIRRRDDATPQPGRRYLSARQRY